MRKCKEAEETAEENAEEAKMLAHRFLSPSHFKFLQVIFISDSSVIHNQRITIIN